MHVFGTDTQIIADDPEGQGRVEAVSITDEKGNSAQNAVPIHLHTERTEPFCCLCEGRKGNERVSSHIEAVQFALMIHTPFCVFEILNHIFPAGVLFIILQSIP